MIHSLDAVLIGRVVPFGARGEPSAIAKRPVYHEIAVGMLGLRAGPATKNNSNGLACIARGSKSLIKAASHMVPCRLKVDAEDL